MIKEVFGVSGKNNTGRLYSKLVDDTISDKTELQELLFAISEAFPLIIWVNLTRNTYKTLEYENYINKKASPGGVFDELIEVGVSTIYPEHQQAFLDAFSRKNLLKAYAMGKKKVELDALQIRDDGGEYGWVRTTVVFINHGNDEVLEITFSRPIEEEKAKELDSVRLRTMVDMAILANFEYITIINTKTGQYELLAHEQENAHNLPEKGDYKKTVLLIRDTLVPAAERVEYYRNASLPHVLKGIQNGKGRYRFRYRITDTPEMRWREAAYQYCLHNTQEILLMVRDVHDEVTAEQMKLHGETLRRDRERQQILNGLGFDVIVDIDLVTASVEVFGEERSFLQRDIIRQRFPMGEIEAGMVHPDDADMLMRIMNTPPQEDSFTVDFRYKRGDGIFFWCRCKAIVLYDGAGKACRYICKLTDIDEQKRTEQRLIETAQRDSLTGLYNSMTTKLLIDDYLSKDGANARHGLLMIDADDFKLVNDNYGHQAGDEVLQALAQKLHASFRSTDIAGRVGGDEFVVFVKDVESVQNVIESAQKLRVRLQEITLKDERENYHPVCSIGIALYPDHGKTYSELFRLADAAMYDIKENGKNNVLLYVGSKEAMHAAHAPVPSLVDDTP